jgi:DNA-binding NarL/FixJ family response regulator
MYAEDHKILRECLVEMLNDNEKFKVIGDAENGLEMLKLLRKQPPDIIITDIEMPEMNGVEMFKIVRRELPDIKFIFLSSHYSSFLALEMANLGVNAYLPKECDIEILEKAICEVHTNGNYFNPIVTNLIITDYMKKLGYPSMINQLSLSARETEILMLICDGKTNKEAAEILEISPATIDFHRQNIYKKTCSSNLAQLMKYAIKNKLISLS